MADIVFLYPTTQREFARSFVPDLTDVLAPFSLWWDEGESRESWSTDFLAALDKTRCALVLWNSEAADMGRQSIMNEMVEAADKNVPLIALCLDDTPMRGPLQGSASIQIDSLEDVTKVESSVFEILSGGRVWKKEIGGSAFEFPSFVRSVSSHETLVSPEHALQALLIHPSTEPILVSSYDLACSAGGRENIDSLLDRLRERGNAIVLDSGNYEAYRKGESADDNSRTYRLDSEDFSVWSHEKHIEVAKTLKAAFAFQYDPTDNLDNSNAHRIVSDALAYFTAEEGNNNCGELVPIAHVPRTKKTNAPQFDKLNSVVEKIVNKVHPNMIAIPERELGDGIIHRAKTLMNLRAELASKGLDCHIHLLGTGNPISIAILAKAGADSFDGLEWCRTVADADKAHLFHAQHFDFFSHQSELSPSKVVREYLTDPSQPWRLKLLLHNLDFFETWMGKLRYHIRRGSIRPLLLNSLTEDQLASLNSELPEILE